MEQPKKSFLTTEESRQGLRMLTQDIKNVASRGVVVKFKFVDILKIIAVCMLAGLSIGVGLEIIRMTLGGL